MAQPPAGTVTFLFTDIEGSTRLWQQYPDSMDAALKHHHTLLNASIAEHGGYVFQIIGDAFCAAFSTANDALEAALQAQHQLTDEKWDQTGPIRVRMVLHTGQAEIQPGDFTSGEYAAGLTLSRASRLLSAGYGGQILLSLATTELIRDHLPPETTLRDLGVRRLKDLFCPEHIFQVLAPGLPFDFPPFKALDVHPHNLPVQLTSFIGREKEMAEIKKLLSRSHLLTLTGTGGTGKTRLALQVAVDLIDEFPSGVWLIELASLNDPSLVVQTVAAVLGVVEQTERSLQDMLVEFAHDRHLLFILDNCEHLVDDCAKLAGLLLHNSPGLKILATSRVHLNLAGERTYPVPPLALPDHKSIQRPQQLLEYEAVRLFIERATDVQPSFDITDENVPKIVQICTHLDGIPLAIELAAARVRHLSLEQITAHLGDRFSLLTGGSRTALPRQQTLRATLDWSYELLNLLERNLLFRLSIFAGSFSLDAVEAVCSDVNGSEKTGISAARVLDLLSSLVNHSLVNLQSGTGENRYILLETVRQYAYEKLQGSGESDNLQARHLKYFAKFADRGVIAVSVGNPGLMEEFEVNYDNLRSAMEFALANDLESAISIMPALAWFNDFSYRLREFYDWSMRLLSLTEAYLPGKVRAVALCMAANGEILYGNLARAKIYMDASWDITKDIDDLDLKVMVFHDLAVVPFLQGDWANAQRIAESYLAIARDQGDIASRVAGLSILGCARYQLGDKTQGLSCIEQSLALARQENFPYYVGGQLRFLADFAFTDGEYPKAIELYTESLQSYKLFVYPASIAYNLYRRGQVELVVGIVEAARKDFDELLATCREYKYEQGLYDYLAGTAGVAAFLGQDERSAKLFSAGIALDRMSSQITDISHKVFDPLIVAVRDHLGVTEFNRIWLEGSKLTLEEALELARQ